jgi:SAM-dependent methyltransferase
MHALFTQIRSWRHAFSLRISERLRISRGVYREKPAERLSNLTARQEERLGQLRERYRVQFEQRLNRRTSLNNYEYLDMLDRAWRAWGDTVPIGRDLCDVGCASFWYAEALQAFFLPRSLVGVEVEGYRLFRNGHSRFDYAAGYLASVPGAEFVVANYAEAPRPADLITAWFPFLTPAAILAWRLPLSLLTPERLFQRIRHNLKAGGVLLMVNHGPAEAELAQGYCIAAGLRRVARYEEVGVFSAYRRSPPVLSCWGPVGLEGAIPLKTRNF